MATATEFLPSHARSNVPVRRASAWRSSKKRSSFVMRAYVLRVLVMGGYYGGAYEEIERGVVPVVYASHRRLACAARSAGRTVEAHVKIDTGMARLGIRMGELERFAETVRQHPEVKISGLMTHLAWCRCRQ